MSQEQKKHPVLESKVGIKIENRHIIFSYNFNCKSGIQSSIHLINNDENILVKSSVDPIDNNELRVFKNNKLVNHLIMVPEDNMQQENQNEICPNQVFKDANAKDKIIKIDL